MCVGGGNGIIWLKLSHLCKSDYMKSKQEGKVRLGGSVLDCHAVWESGMIMKPNLSVKRVSQYYGLLYISMSPKSLTRSKAGLLENNWIMGFTADLLLGGEVWSEELCHCGWALEEFVSLSAFSLVLSSSCISPPCCPALKPANYGWKMSQNRLLLV